MKENGSYQFEKLEGRFTEAARLEERTHLRLEGFHDLLIRHQYPKAGKVLEIGAAQGIRCQLMAQYFPESQVIGLDRSPELLKLAQDHHHHDQLNLTFELGDLYDLKFMDESFDFIYARLVFMHLSDPKAALASLYRVLKPGGRLLIEDADRDCMFFEPTPRSFPHFWEKVQIGQQKLGGDPNVGRKLAPYLKEAGFQNLQIETQPIIGAGKEIEFLARTLMPSLNTYLDPQDRPEGEVAISDLHNLSKDPRATFYHFWFVVSGEKRS